MDATASCQQLEPCSHDHCRRGCALETVDELLQAAGGVRGEEIDLLLDLRSLLRRRENPEAALAIFCQLRRAMEERHYLSFYRLRRWLENHVEVTVVPFRGAPERTVGLKLDRFCLEAVRWQCLQGALKPGEILLAPRAQFQFRAVAPQPVAAGV